MNKDNETIRLQDLSIGYSGKKSHVKLVAEHISASIHSGELTCLIGSNGVGKSTLLRTLSAFQPKINGEIFINGKEISKYNDKQLSHVIGVVLTGKPHIHNITVTELVGLGRSPYTDFWGNLKDEDKEVVRRSLDMVGIEHLSERMIQTLSDGERQKVMIAKALAQQTPIIFLDEPTAFLDYPSKVEMMQLLHRLSRETDKTIFLSTHDIELALQITDVIWFMERGKGVSIGTPHELASNGTLGRYIEREGIKLNTEDLTIKVNVK
jgi:iron complex transport system ATP-binding protein